MCLFCFRFGQNQPLTFAASTHRYGRPGAMARQLQSSGRFGYRNVQLIKERGSLPRHRLLYRAKCGQFSCAAKVLHPILFDRVQHFGGEVHSLGIGSYGAVYRAKCGQFPCAAKVLHPILFATRDPSSHRIIENFRA